MARDMFGDIVDPSIKVGSKKWYTVPLSIVVHTVILLALVIIPLMAEDVLPTPAAMMNAFVAAAPRVSKPCLLSTWRLPTRRAERYLPLLLRARMRRRFNTAFFPLARLLSFFLLRFPFGVGIGESFW